MSIFKYAVLSLLLIVPMLGKASIVGSGAESTETTLTNPVYNTSEIIFDDSVGNDGVSLVKTFGPIIDIWTLEVGINSVVTIEFSPFVTPLLNSPFSKFSVETQDNYPALAYLGNNTFRTNVPDFYDFVVIGKTLNDNQALYSVVTNVTAVPLPAAVWLFGTALFGVLSISKRKHQL